MTTPIALSMAEQTKRSEKRINAQLDDNIFYCEQPEESRSRQCSGKFYRIREKQTLCEFCETKNDGHGRTVEMVGGYW